MPNRRNSLYLLIIAALLAGLFTGRALFFNLAYLLGGLWFLALIWSFFSVRGLGIRRITRTRRAQVGRLFAEAFMVRNAALLPKLWVEIRDFSDLPNHYASHVVPSLNITGRHNWQVNTPCNMRGEFRIGPLAITSGDPFGLFSNTRHIAATERILVYPAVQAITKVQLPVGLLSGGEAQRYQTQNITTNAAGVREYVPGDSINRIHWKSTARRGKLIVKEFELDPLVDIWLFLDLSVASLVDAPGVVRQGNHGRIISNSSQTPPSTEEYAIVAAASLANYFIVDQDRTLGFISYTPHREIAQPERGQRQLMRILETLAIAQSHTQHTLREMLALEAHRFMRGTTLIIITSSLEINWVTEAQLLAHRGIRPLCVLIDPATFNPQADSEELRATLRITKVPTLLVQNGDNIGQALAGIPH